MTIGQLIKSLITKNWIPRGDKEIVHSVYDKKHKMLGFYKEGKQYLELLFKKSLRELISKDSGLWQFVCENGMTEKHTDIRVRCNEKTSKTYQDSYVHQHYEYRLIESALKDESELEQFLLDNIKIGDI